MNGVFWNGRSRSAAVPHTTAMAATSCQPSSRAITPSRADPSIGPGSATLGAHLAPKIFHRGLEAAASVRDAQGAERHLDRTEHAEHHRCVDVAHVGDPECVALQVTDPTAEDDAALLATIVAEHARLAALREHRGHRV